MLLTDSLKTLQERTGCHWKEVWENSQQAVGLPSVLICVNFVWSTKKIVAYYYNDVVEITWMAVPHVHSQLHKVRHTKHCPTSWNWKCIPQLSAYRENEDRLCAGVTCTDGQHCFKHWEDGVETGSKT